MTPLSLSTKVLIAVPQLLDPHFHRAVVLLIEHDAEGSLGLIINDPTEHPCAEVIARFDLTWQGDSADLLHRGGPVEPQALWMLHADTFAVEDSTPAVAGVAVSRSREALSQLCAQAGLPTRLLIGYAGWGPGQLEEEIAQGSWIIAPASAAMVFEWPVDLVWRRALESVGVDPARLVAGSGSVH